MSEIFFNNYSFRYPLVHTTRRRHFSKRGSPWTSGYSDPHYNFIRNNVISSRTRCRRALHNELHSCSGTTTSTFDARRIIFYVLYIGTYANWRVYLCSWAEEIYNSNSLTWLRHFTRIHDCYDIITGYLYNRSWRIIIRVICHDNKILHRRIPPLHTSRLVWTRNAYIIVIISYTPIYVTTEGIL